MCQVLGRDPLPLRQVDIDKVPHLSGVVRLLVLGVELVEEAEEVLGLVIREYCTKIC